MVYSKRELYKIARKEGLTVKQAREFAEFMKQRFPKESYMSYIIEWARRWKTGKPEMWADNISLLIIKKIKKTKKE